MQVDLNHLVNAYEVVPVSFGDPFKNLIVDPSTLQLLRFLPIIGFIALLMAAVLIQIRKFPEKAISNLKEANNEE